MLENPVNSYNKKNDNKYYNPLNYDDGKFKKCTLLQ